jgi:hypothetical protein
MKKSINFKASIMNPPYGKRSILPFNVLTKITNHVVRENKGTVVSLQTAGWVNDPLSITNPKNYIYIFAPKLDRIIHTIKLIPVLDARKLFGYVPFFGTDLGIYKLAQNGKSVKDFCNLVPEIIKKVMKLPSLWDAAKVLQKGNYPIYISFTHGNRGYDDFYDVVKKKYHKAKPMKSLHDLCFRFETENEAKNFFHSLQTLFIKYIHSLVKTNQRNRLEVLPWMEDYTKEWTDERFFEYFKINTEEQETIKNHMEAIYSKIG